MKQFNRTYAEVNLDAIRHNIDEVHKNIKEGTKVMAIVKANAYGHGAVQVAKALYDQVDAYGVAMIEEAIELRKAGIDKLILILGYTGEESYEDLVQYQISQTVYTWEMAEQLSETALKHGKKAKIHIKVDTGMSRIGLQVTEDSADLIAGIAKLPNIEIEGIFTHFAQADEYDKTPTQKQIALFQKMITMLEERNVKIPIHHCSNSAGIVEIPEANMDMVRAGITLYGMWPSEEVAHNISLHPVMSLKSHIAFVKTLGKGRKISYGGIYETPSEKRIATIPVGYADGYARGLSNKGYVLIHGKKAPICGRVCMDQFMVDVTEIPEAKEGDPVTLLGKDGSECITMEELGELSGRFNYEFACLITPRVPRICIQES